MLPNDPAILQAWQAAAKRRVPTAAEAYARAVAADRLREPQVQIGYRLYWMSNAVFGSQEVYVGPSGYAVVGRHSCSDIVLDDERDVSLRHLIVRATALDDGFPVLTVLDLQSASGFELSDGSQQRSVAITGPVVFRVGGTMLVALPSTGKYPDTLPVPLVEAGGVGGAGGHRIEAKRIDPRVLGAAAASAVAAAAGVKGGHLRLVPPAPADEPRAPQEPAPRSRITSLPGSIDFSRRASSVPSFSGRPSDADYVITGVGYEVVVELNGCRAGVRLTKADLEQGVLIGRAEKCVDEGLRSVLSQYISRVHVLLVCEESELRLYDTASMSGTFQDGTRIRSIPLLDSGTTVNLASRMGGVTLHWRAL